VVKTWEIAKATRDAAVVSASSIAEMRLSREAATAPHVAIYFSAASTTFAEIVLENFGEGTAANVRCSFEPPLQSTMNGNPAQFFAVPKWLPPRSRLSHGFDTWMHYLPSKLPRRYQVTVEYSDVSLTKAYKIEYVLDASSFEHMLKWEQKGLHELVKVADDLKSQLGSSLDRAQQVEDARDRVSEVFPISVSADESVAAILSSWDLLAALVRAPHTMAFDTPYRSVMSRAAASAFAAAVRTGLAPDQRQLIENVFVAVHHHDFDVMGDHAPARQALEQAVLALRTNWVFSPVEGPLPPSLVAPSA
jgi:hypothetical protein